MKKIFLSITMLIGISIGSNAQWSGMTVINHSGCDYMIRLGANYTSKFTSCNYQNTDLLITAGNTFSAPTYMNWDATVSPFVAGSPSAPITYTPAGIAPAWGTSGCFTWVTCMVWPAGYTPSPPGTNNGSPCGNTQVIGDGSCGPDNPTPPNHIWSRNPTTGDVIIDLY
jgi:hypothetical protein